MFSLNQEIGTEVAPMNDEFKKACNKLKETRSKQDEVYNFIKEKLFQSLENHKSS